MAKDVLIGTISGYELGTIQYWLNSLDACGFAGDKVVLACNADRRVVEGLRSRLYEVVTYATDPATGNAYYPAESFQDEDASAERFYLMWQYLAARRREDYRYVVSVDVRDAVFQSDPSKWLEDNLGDKELNVSSEAVRYDDEEWNRASVIDNFGRTLHERMRSHVIWNAGVIAGAAPVFRDLCLNVHLLCRASRLPYSDQAALNIILSMEQYRRLTRFNASEDGWACHGGAFGDPVLTGKLLEPAPTFDGAHVYTSSGKKYCVVHQYDRVPAWREALQKKYAGAGSATTPPPR